MKAVLIPGDGIGREIAESVREVSAALNTGIEWQEFAAGAEYAAESGELIAPGALDAIEACGWALKGPTATPIGKGFVSEKGKLIATSFPATFPREASPPDVGRA